jgi:hypothetical protein
MEFELSKASSENSGVVNELQYKLGHVANYIVGRSSVLYYASGSSSYQPRGSRTIRINLTGDQAWLDPSTVNLRFKFNNLSADEDIKLISSLPSNFFYRLRILCGQNVIEDITPYHRTAALIEALMPAEKRYNNHNMGFGSNDDVDADGNYHQINFESTNTPPQVSAGKSRVVQVALFSGILSQPKYLPLDLMKSLTIELELVGDVNDCICRETPETVYNWSITEPVIVADVVTLDQSLQNEFVNAMMDGESLPISYNSFICQLQTLSNSNENTISLSRSFTRLKSLFITFFKEVKTIERVAGRNDYQYTNTVDTQIPLNNINLFYHKNFLTPIGHDLNKFGDLAGVADIQKAGYYRYVSENDNLSCQIQIGPKLFPDQPIESLASAYYHLRKTLGNIKPMNPFSMNISDKEYRSHKFILGIDLEKCDSAEFSGVNSRASDLITIKLKNMYHTKPIGDAVGQFLPNSNPEYLYATLQYSAVLLISDKGVQCLE